MLLKMSKHLNVTIFVDGIVLTWIASISDTVELVYCGHLGSSPDYIKVYGLCGCLHFQ